MGVNSGISWTHNTWNPWMGCDKVAPECAHCYIFYQIRKMMNRETGEFRKPWGEIFRTSEDLWKNPLRWEKKAAKRGRAIRVFTCSESDFFHQGADEWRPEAWAIIKNTPHLTYQILTKRPGRIASHLPPDWNGGYRNVWLGVSAACNQSMIQIDKLRAVQARVKFVSAEPLLEDVSQAINLDGIDWLICGGESGFGDEYLWTPGTPFLEEPDGRRTMELSWARNLQAACEKAGTIFFFKQITATRSGKGAHALGRLYHEYPAAPFEWYTKEEFMADFGTKKEREKLIQIGGAL
jgi:protein gp37